MTDIELFILMVLAFLSTLSLMAIAAQWKDKLIKLAKSEEHVGEELEDTTQTITYKGKVYTRRYKDKLDAFACKYPISVPKPSKRYAKYSNVDLIIAIKEGAKWQKEHLWKSADGDDLPDYEREVVAFQETFPTDVDVPSLFKIVIAHRPNPNGWDGKSITTGNAEHYTPKTYDKGGWNIPDVKFWLDVELPKEIEL